MTEERANDKTPNLFYGAPAVFFISHRKQNLQEGIEWANVTTVTNQMHLATGFEPLIALAVGYPEKELGNNPKQHAPISVNFINLP